MCAFVTSSQLNTIPVFFRVFLWKFGHDYSFILPVVTKACFPQLFLNINHEDVSSQVHPAVAEQGGIAFRGQIYMGAPIGIVEIHMQLEIATPCPHPHPPLLRQCHPEVQQLQLQISIMSRTPMNV